MVSLCLVARGPWKDAMNWLKTPASVGIHDLDDLDEGVEPGPHDPRLPAGWSRIITMTGDGTCSVSILDSGGRVYREELRRFLLTSGQISLVDPNKIDFSVFGQDL